MFTVMSGLTFGFTGSYIFSQTIFTYRTGVHSRAVGCMIMAMFLYIVVSPVNILEIAPLFFLGSTLIFIGWDLLFEWFIQIRDRVLLSEYATIWGTFIAIQVVGVDFGIVVGVLVAIVDNVVTTAQATTVKQTHKRSRAVWTPAEYKVLQDHGYHPKSPQIVSAEISGPVFFGSSLALFDTLVNILGVDDDMRMQSSSAQTIFDARTPHTSSALLMTPRTPGRSSKKTAPVALPPQFCVLDFSQVSSMDASAARTCFLQFALLCSKKGIVVCAACLTPRMQWMLRSHDVAYDETEEETMKAKIQAPHGPRRLRPHFGCERLLLFLTVHEALEFCEDALLHQMPVKRSSALALFAGPDELKFSSAIARFLDASQEHSQVLSRVDGLRYYEELEFKSGEKIFLKGSHPNAWYIVLQGQCASDVGNAKAIYRYRQQTVSGAGIVKVEQRSVGRGGPAVVATVWGPCNIFGYTDMFLERPRTFTAVAIQDGTRVARITKSHMKEMAQDTELSALFYQALLKASVLDLQNCTCDDV
jgi:CRP-like cAMP-binding protein